MGYSNEFLARVYGAYMGRWCRFQPYLNVNDGTDSKRWVTGRIVGVHQSKVLIQGYDLQGLEWSNIYEYDFALVQPILTPISAITDEHAIEVGKILYGEPLSEQKEILIFQIQRTKKFVPTLNATPIIGELYIRVYDYLRSRGYDCGYGEIPSLIEAGLALDKTTLNN